MNYFSSVFILKIITPSRFLESDSTMWSLQSHALTFGHVVRFSHTNSRTVDERPAAVVRTGEKCD
ncbi:hypothetical protein C8J57DRAFT_1485008 [Mycena rebaudengoi]|nr:hypothetical protein C8J57DRAFT_1485008 [Mycena rebaudengoi]